MSLGILLDIVHISNLALRHRDPVLVKIFEEGEYIRRVFNKELSTTTREVSDIVEGFLYATTFDHENYCQGQLEQFYASDSARIFARL